MNQFQENKRKTYFRLTESHLLMLLLMFLTNLTMASASKDILFDPLFLFSRSYKPISSHCVVCSYHITTANKILGQLVESILLELLPNRLQQVCHRASHVQDDFLQIDVVQFESKFVEHAVRLKMKKSFIDFVSSSHSN